MLDLLSNISTQWRQEEFLKICSEEKLAENLKAPQIEVTIPIKTSHQSCDTGMRSTQSGDCVLPPAGARRYEANHRGIEGEHWEIERGTWNTLVERQSWGPSNDGGPRMVNWESQSNTPSQSPEDGHIYCILLICIEFRRVSERLPLYCLFYVTTNIYFCFLYNTEVSSSRSCLYLLNINHFTYTFSHAHVEARTHKHTCIISTQEE